MLRCWENNDSQIGTDVANDVAEDTGDVDVLLYREVQNILEVTNYLYLCSAHLQLEGVSGLGLSWYRSEPCVFYITSLRRFFIFFFIPFSAYGRFKGNDIFLSRLHSLHSLHFGVRELVEECEEYCPYLIKKGEIVWFLWNNLRRNSRGFLCKWKSANWHSSQSYWNQLLFSWGIRWLMAKGFVNMCT